ncbi:MAG: uracil-DNA glycosylase [Proteobacteria bacterium]|nr:uracil-DNA glycosylase [Pseudomonadota bacterium]
MRKDQPTYYNAPVRAWGAVNARLLILGLAPGMHGANRTGQPFTGDASGYFLFEALERAGLASHAIPEQAKLIGSRITNVVKCLPPANLPLPVEMNTCRTYLLQEIDELWKPGVRKPRAILALGAQAYAGAAKALEVRLPKFEHGVNSEARDQLWVFGSYHPSRRNVNTGRIDMASFEDIVRRVCGVLGLDAG